MSAPIGNPEATSAMYRNVLVELDQMRNALIATVGDTCQAIASVSHYRAEVQAALHDMGVQA